jgi:hypothetical protein
MGAPTVTLTPTRIEQAVMLTYGQLVPEGEAALVALEEHLFAGAELSRGFAREELGSGGASFQLGDVMSDSETRILCGRIGQTESQAVTVQRFDPYEREFVPDHTVGERTLTAAFAVHLDEGWVLMEDLGQDLPPQALIEVLSGLVNQDVEPARWVRGTLAEQEEDPFAFMARVDRVTRVAVGLRPSNPGGETWREYDELLERARAKKLRVSFENEEGLNVPREGVGPSDGENPVAAALALAEKYPTDEKVQIDAEFDGAKASYDGETRSGRLNDEVAPEELAVSEHQDPLLSALRGRLSRAVNFGLFHRWHTASD